MAISLYEVTVLGFIQTVGALEGALKKGRDWCVEKGVSPEELVETRIYADMFPLRFQVCQIANHSVGAIEAVKAGRYGRPDVPQLDYAGLQQLLADTSAKLKACKPAEVNALEGKEVLFNPVEHLKMNFTATDFLLSFSLPNFHFHATTAYDILRMKGVPVGKRDYLGQMRVKN